jgi:hypothetical protein
VSNAATISWGSGKAAKAGSWTFTPGTTGAVVARAGATNPPDPHKRQFELLTAYRDQFYGYANGTATHAQQAKIFKESSAILEGLRKVNYGGMNNRPATGGLSLYERIVADMEDANLVAQQGFRRSAAPDLSALQSAYALWRSTLNDLNSESFSHFNMGSSSQQILNAFGDDALRISSRISQYAEALQSFSTAVTTALKKGYSYTELAYYMSSEDKSNLAYSRRGKDAMNYVTELIKDPMATLNSKLSEYADQLKQVENSFTSTKLSEDERKKFENIVGMIELVFAGLTGLGLACNITNMGWMLVNRYTQKFGEVSDVANKMGRMADLSRAVDGERRVIGANRKAISDIKVRLKDPNLPQSQKNIMLARLSELEANNASRLSRIAADEKVLDTIQGQLDSLRRNRRDTDNSIINLWVGTTGFVIATPNNGNGVKEKINTYRKQLQQGTPLTDEQRNELEKLTSANNKVQAALLDEWGAELRNMLKPDEAAVARFTENGSRLWAKVQRAYKMVGDETTTLTFTLPGADGHDDKKVYSKIADWIRENPNVSDVRKNSLQIDILGEENTTTNWNGDYEVTKLNSITFTVTIHSLPSPFGVINEAFGGLSGAAVLPAIPGEVALTKKIEDWEE